MEQSRHIRSISFLFLAIFLATKLIGLHALTHTDDKGYLDHCEICHNIASNDHAPGIINDPMEPLIENDSVILQKGIVIEYNFQVSGMLSTSYLFSRPPPIV